MGHALGLAHSNDKQDIMYPTNEQIDNTNPIFLKYGSLILFVAYTTLAVVVFLSISWLLRRKELEDNTSNKGRRGGNHSPEKKEK